MLTIAQNIHRYLYFAHVLQFRSALTKLQTDAKKISIYNLFKAEPFDETKKAVMVDLATFLGNRNVGILIHTASQKYIIEVLAEIARWDTAAMSRTNCVKIYVTSFIASIIGDDSKIPDVDIIKVVEEWIHGYFNREDIEELVASMTNVRLSSSRGRNAFMRTAQGLEVTPFYEHVPQVLSMLQLEEANFPGNPRIHRLAELGDLLFGKKYT